MKLVTKYFLSNPGAGAPINSNGVVLGVGETTEIPEVVGRELARRYGFLAFYSREVEVKEKKAKKEKTEEVEPINPMSLEALSIMAEGLKLAPSKIKRVLVNRILKALGEDKSKEGKDLIKMLKKEVVKFEKEDVAKEAQVKKDAKKK